MTFGTAVSKDLSSAVLMQSGGSPKVIYTTFLLGLVREFFGLIISENIDEKRIERGFTTLVSFCPNTDARGAIWVAYSNRRKEGQGISSAAINSCGNLIDYLSEELSLTETAEGDFF